MFDQAHTRATPGPAPLRWPELSGIAYGGDYTPE